MGDKSRHPGRAGLVLAPALVLALCLFVAGGNAVAAENAVRMPVEKGAAPDPLGELVKPKKAPEDKKPEAEARHPGEKKAEPAPVARGEAKKSEPEAKKPETKKPEAKKPEAEGKKPEAKKAEAPKAEPKKAEPQKAPEAAKPVAKPGKKPEPEKAASPAPEQKAEAPKPEKKPVAEKKPEPEKKAAPAPKSAAEKKPETAMKSETVKKPEARPAAKTPAKPVAKSVAKSDPSANATQQLVDAPAPAVLKPAPKPEAASAPTPAPTPKPEAKPAPEPAPKPVPAPKPKPVADPVAFVMPAGPSNPAPAIELPKEGLYVGDLKIEFQHTQIILRAATSEPVERVTTFYLKGPRRLALDLRGNWAKKGGTVVRYDTGPVKHIVVGEHPDRLRLTLEFREGAVRPDLDPTVVREPGGGVTATIPLAR